MLNGVFTPSSNAKTLSSASIFNRPSTPITARFSSSTGIPQIPDTDPSGNPRGLAIRFHIADRAHTDIVGHSTPFFPTRTGADFLQFLKALTASPPGTPSPTPIEAFFSSYPSALAFVQAPKPTPSSFARETYFGVTALKFVSTEEKTTYFRYRVVPDAGDDFLDDDAVKKKDANFLYDELPKRAGEGPITFRLMAQLAEEGDVVDDSTVRWPESRPIVELGTLNLEGLVPNHTQEQKHIIFDPIPRVPGIEPSEDPLLELRAAVYLISGRERRAVR